MNYKIPRLSSLSIAKFGKVDLMERIVNQGFFPEENTLMVAVESGSLELVKWLVERDSPFNSEATRRHWTK
jgi:hypothetical protein